VKGNKKNVKPRCCLLLLCSMHIKKPRSNETLLKERSLPKDIEEGAADIGLKVTRIPCIRHSELWTTVGMVV